MTEKPLPADICKTMAEVRVGVDALDLKLVDLLTQRFAYMDAAARIKVDRGAVRDEARKDEVLANVAAFALERGLPVDVVREIWDVLVEGSIAYELKAWDALKD